MILFLLYFLFILGIYTLINVSVLDQELTLIKYINFLLCKTDLAVEGVNYIKNVNSCNNVIYEYSLNQKNTHFTYLYCLRNEKEVYDNIYIYQDFFLNFNSIKEILIQITFYISKIILYWYWVFKCIFLYLLENKELPEPAIKYFLNEIKLFHETTWLRYNFRGWWSHVNPFDEASIYTDKYVNTTLKERIGDGGVLNKAQYKEAFAYQILKEYVDFIDNLTEEREVYISDLRNYIKENLLYIFPAYELGIENNLIENICDFTKYLGFDSRAYQRQLVRTDDFKFKAFYAWYHAEYFMRPYPRYLRLCELLRNQNVKKEYILDSFIEYLYNREDNWRASSILVPTDPVFILSEVIPKLVNIINTVWIYHAHNVYYRLDHAYLLKLNVRNSDLYSYKQIHNISFERHFIKSKNDFPYVKAMLETKNITLNVPVLSEDIVEPVNTYVRNVRRFMSMKKVHFFESCKKIYKMFAKGTPGSLLSDTINQDGYNERILFRKLVQVRKEHSVRSKRGFRDATLVAKDIIKELKWKGYGADFRFSPRAGNNRVRNVFDEFACTNKTYEALFMNGFFEPQKMLVDLWLASKFELLAMYMYHTIDVPAFEELWFFKYLNYISPQFAYLVGKYYYSFLIYLYQDGYSDFLIFVMYHLYYDLQNLMIGLHSGVGVVCQWVVCLTGIASCVFLLSDYSSKSSLLLRLIAIETILVSFAFCVMMALSSRIFMDNFWAQLQTWTLGRMPIHYHLGTMSDVQFLNQHVMLFIFLLFFIFACECAFGILILVIAYKRMTQYHKLDKNFEVASTRVTLNYGFGLIKENVAPSTSRYLSTSFDRRSMDVKKGHIFLVPNELDNDKVSERVKNYSILKPEKDVKDFIRKYESEGKDIYEKKLKSGYLGFALKDIKLDDKKS